VKALALLPLVALALLPTGARAEAADSQLLGCWALVHQDARIAEKYEVCFHGDGTVETMRWLTDEGLGSSGPYEVEGEVIHVRDSFAFPDGWLFGSEEATCSVSVSGDKLILGNCSGSGVVPFSMQLVRISP
jgi:hypothetical protein